LEQTYDLLKDYRMGLSYGNVTSEVIL